MFRILQVLQTLVTNQNDYLKSGGQKRILTEIILPNMIWKAGQKAIACREKAVALLEILIANLTSNSILEDLNTQVLAAVLGASDDDEIQTRMACLRIFQQLFNINLKMTSKPCILMNR
jgi:hypothetical protein